MLVIQISPSFICYSTAMSWFAWCKQMDLQWENVQVSRLLFQRTTGATRGQTSVNTLSIVVQPLAKRRQQVELRMFRILPDAN
ncbi:unnamed protein product, partial [Mesorhabditis belari]|uniref:Uncharacterized protein n=1 Tax=Mesorhabditis belari TaxID=2138241 RepID=A0AAF3J3E1_9BILA